MDNLLINGSVEPGFEKVKDVFTENFQKGEEVGAACAIYHKGKKVVDLWGGYRDKKTKDPWKEDTLVLMFSTTKGVSAMAMALAHSKGYFDYDEKVSKYWPEFAANGKENVTVRQLLSHQAGLCAIDEPLDLEILGDTERLSKILAAQTPLWEPGKKHGYHAISLGWYESELIRKTDPQNRTMGQFFQDEIAKPLGLEFYIGLPDNVPDSRIANMHAPLYTLRLIFNTKKMPKPFVKAIMKKGTATKRTFSNPKILGVIKKYNSRAVRRIELPAANGIGQVRDVAKLYGIFSMGASELGIKPETMEAIKEPAKEPENGRFDEVLQSESMFSLGFLKPFPECQFGTSKKAFGTPGAGGSFGFADPDTQTGFAYAMNKSGFYLLVDPRQDNLAKAFFECLKEK